MSTPTVPQPSPMPFRFARNFEFLSGAGSAGIEVQGARDQDVFAALFSDSAPFPDREIELGSIAVKAETARPIEFGLGQARVSFKAGGGAHAGLGVYPDPARAAGELTPDRTRLPLDLSPVPGEVFVLLRWGFDAEAHLKGAVALGAVGKAVLGVDGSTESLFAVVRRLPKTVPARKLVQRTVESWMLPRQVDSPDHLEPGTWLVAEVDGAIGIKIGAQFGYDFNWIRETELEGLEGDIGLRLQLGISAAAGFTGSGKHALVISRPSDDPVLRLQLFKLRNRGWNFALDAGAVAKPVDTVLPKKADDLIRAVFRLHGAQILEDLKLVEKWTDPSVKLQDLLAAAGMDQAVRLIAHLGDVPADRIESSFDRLQETVVRFVRQWRSLDHRAATLLLKFVEERVDLEPVRRLAAQVAGATTSEGLKKLLAESLSDVDFFQTPQGRWIESIAADGALYLLARPIEEVRKSAELTLAVLDGSRLQEVLGRFQRYLEENLNVARFLDAVTQPEFAGFDGLLKKKLGDFLGRTFEFQDVEKIRTTVHVLLGKRQEFYERALNAMHRKYEFELAAAYQKSTQDEALLDVSFDFRSNHPGVQRLLRQALKGEFDELLTAPSRGVSLNLGVLSHRVRRQSHVELTLPYYEFKTQHVNESLATVRVQEDQGGVLVYELDARDSVATNRRNSTLSVGAQVGLQAQEGSGVRLYSRQPLTYSYSMRQAIKNMERADVEYQVGPLIETYFPAAFAQRPFGEWLDYLDRRTEELVPGTPDFFGSTLLRLDVTLSAEDAGAIGRLWFNLPRKKNAPPYLRMSLGIQNELKRIIPFLFFHNPQRYVDRVPAQLLLAYSAIPPAHRIVLDPAGEPKVDEGALYWDWRNPDLRHAMLARMPQTRTRMREALTRVNLRLARTPGFQSLAADYDPGRTEAMLGRVSAADSGDTPISHLLSGLLQAESLIIDEAFKAGKAIAEFRVEAPGRPSRALKKLAEFGSRLVDAFNDQIRSAYLDGALRPLGTQVFLAATRAISDDGSRWKQNAILSLSVMKKDWEFEPQTFIAKGTVQEADVVLRERLVSLE